MTPASKSSPLCIHRGPNSLVNCFVASVGKGGLERPGCHNASIVGTGQLPSQNIWGYGRQGLDGYLCLIYPYLHDRCVLVMSKTIVANLRRAISGLINLKAANMRLSALVSHLALSSLAAAAAIAGHSFGPFNIISDLERRDALQNLVTWDAHSLFIRGERVMIYSGEFHPFRLPVPSLWLDVFQKVKALGFNAVSFYVNWALVEAKEGEYRADGIFDLDPFFKAAETAGIFLIARPGPYINAEVAGGGFPGRLQRLAAQLRTKSPEFLNATENYMSNIVPLIAKYQITNGGPVILYQAENEYSISNGKVPFPDGDYMQAVIDQARRLGIKVPIVNNDASKDGHNRPGTGAGEIDIYGYDAYPLGFDCSKPTSWRSDALPGDYYEVHMKNSPKTPFLINEFGGGSYDPYGGVGYDNCAALTNHEYERVFNKGTLTGGIGILNVYMLFGGTNWGNLGHSRGYTSYDYGSAIREDRYLDREKYSELKLEALFNRASPAYLVTTPGELSTSVYTDNPNIAVTPLKSNGTGDYYVVRHSDYQITTSASYKLRLPTSNGTLTVPQTNGSLTLPGRDTKIHVTDYAVGNHTMHYCTAEILTWQKVGDQTILILYSGLGEFHELAFRGSHNVTQIEGNKVSAPASSMNTVVSWTVDTKRQVIQVNNLTIYLLDRNSAYNYWVPVLPSDKNGNFGTSIMNTDAVIINGPYLVRSADVSDSTLNIQADFNKTAEFEVIGAPKGVSKLSINGKSTEFTTSKPGTWLAKPDITFPEVKLPDLKSLEWMSIDSLPELQPGYDDSQWTRAQNFTRNSVWPLNTPVSLYGGDYGFNTGTLLFRGRFNATGSETSLSMRTMGGNAFASSVWLDGTFVGATLAQANNDDATSNYTIPKLDAGTPHVLTIVVDNMGLNMDFIIGDEDMKRPRGILKYSLDTSSGGQTDIYSWKITGNLGGEDYKDHFRGPLNEGGLFVERQGYHQPDPPQDKFVKKSPFEQHDGAGIQFYAAKFALDLPAKDYDIPLSFVIDNSTAASPYHGFLYVNGFQFGKYISYLGPQTSFPVPEGILNYGGDNWVGLAVWALDKAGVSVPGLSLSARQPVLTGRQPVELVASPKWEKRTDAY
ncbi:beta-galactosidase lacA [Cordyceps militaris CM01]|uniref:Beta-galactosidase n=1 Tax=Cordyceps militaris (strain CM01) TaxID=983644 RepID=G3JS07_CORMM|nr:beta-galactosidase lacA [Cordyceps militaris CM01]EGX88653.1 beta-galactosidase lacA [Cordyceps militaris CM01]